MNTTSTARNFATEAEPGLCRLAETINGRMAIADALELASSSALAQNDPNAKGWIIDLACQAMLSNLRKAGWKGESLNELFLTVLPEHPSHSALLKVIEEMPKGQKLKSHIEKGYLASMGCNHKNAIPIVLPH